MKTRVLLAAAVIVMEGCKPARQTPAVPPPAPVVPSAVSNSLAGTALSADERSLQTLRDLGVTPEVMLQLVRSQLAAASTSPAPDSQPPPMAVAGPAPVAAVPDTAPPVEQAQEPELVATGEPEPVEDFPASQDQAQPMVIVVTNTVVIREIQDFHAPLDNYGTWVELPTYGRVWQPAVTIVDVNWRPYQQCGRWIHTDYGWYWQSDYSWGWAAFHYGRWCYMSGYRWIWVPDTVWGPAWVSWRRSETHCGWAALPPGTPFQVGVGFTIADGGDFDTHCGLSPRHYCFVPVERFCDRDPHQAMVENLRVEAIYHGSAHIRSSHVWDSRERRVHNMGPDRKGFREVARRATARLHVATAPDAVDSTEKPRRVRQHAAETVATEKPDKPEKPRRAESVPAEKPDKPEKPQRAEPVPEEPVVQVESVPAEKPDKPDKPEKPRRAEPVPEEPIVQVEVPAEKPDKPGKPGKPQRAEPVAEEPIVQVESVPAEKPDKPDKPGKPQRAEPAVDGGLERTVKVSERTSRRLDVHAPVAIAAGQGNVSTSSAVRHGETAPSARYVPPEGLRTPAPVATSRAEAPVEPKSVKRVTSPVEVQQGLPSLHDAAAPQAPRSNPSAVRATAPPVVETKARGAAAVPSALQRENVSVAPTPAVKKADKVEKADKVDKSDRADKNGKSSGRSGSDKKHSDDSDDPW